MAAKKCPHCNYRILQPDKDPVCPNCGKPHTAPTASAPTPLPAPRGGYPRPVPVPPAPVIPVPPAPVPAPRPPAPVPAPAPPPVARIPGMPSRPADIEGIIASHPDTREEVLRTHWSHTTLGCIFYPLLLIFSPVLFIFSVLGMNSRPDRRISITTARVRRADGTIRDIRFEGDLIRSKVALGDQVSLWGGERNGVLIVRRGYNHTTGSEIVIRAPQLPWLSIIVLMILLALVVMACVLCNTSTYYHG